MTSFPQRDPNKRAATAVSVLFFVCGAGFANWIARIPSVRNELALSDQTLGLVLLCTAIGAMVAFRVAGRLLHRYGSKRVASVSTCAFAVLLITPTLAWNATSIACALFVMGAASGLMDVAMNTQAVEVENRLGKPILSRFHGIFSLGGLVGAGTGALAAQGNIPPTWHLTAVAAVLICGVLGISRSLLAVAGGTGHSAFAKPRGILLVMGIVAFCSSVGEGAMADWTAVYLHDDLGTGAGLAGAGYACYSAAMVVGRLSGDRIASKMPPSQIVRISGLIVSFGLSIGLLINTPLSVMVGVTFVGGGLSIIIPVVFRAAGKIPDVHPGAALATLATLSYGGFLLGPPSIGFVADHMGLRVGLCVVVVLAMVLTALAPSVKQP